MAERSFIWEEDEGGDASPHSQSESAAIMAALAGAASDTEGVLRRLEDELQPSAIAGNTQVRVGPGWAVALGHPYHNDANSDLTPVTPSVGTTGRRRGLLVDDDAQTVRLTEISSDDGTAALPSIPANFVPICSYTVTTGGDVGAFADEREFASGDAEPQVEIFTADGTWNKSPWSWVLVEVISAGGGGGGARIGSNNNTGGTGGGGGARGRRLYHVDELPDTVSIVVGAGGDGGNAGDTGQSGTAGGNSQFGDDFIVIGGAGGAGGGGTSRAGVHGGRVGPGLREPTATGSPHDAAGEQSGGGAPAGNAWDGGCAEFGGAGSGRAANTTAGRSGGSSLYGAGAGGSGGGADGGTNRAGGAGGRSGRYEPGGGGAAGSSSSPPANNGGHGEDGTTPTFNLSDSRLGAGGGGGGSAWSTDGNGGNGGAPGGGGGGGGSKTSGSGSNGGNGARGEVRIWTW